MLLQLNKIFTWVAENPSVRIYSLYAEQYAFPNIGPFKICLQNFYIAVFYVIMELLYCTLGDQIRRLLVENITFGYNQRHPSPCHAY